MDEKLKCGEKKKTIKPTEDSVRYYLCELGVWKDLLNKIPKA